MKKILTLFLTLVFILSFQQNSYAYQTKWRNTVWAYDLALFRFDYEELYKLLDKFKNNKISRDECVVAGIKFLKENENKISSGDSCDIQSVYKMKHNSPTKFMAFIYANYKRFSPDALKELKSSLWDLTPYLNRSFTSQEIELMNSIEPTISLNFCPNKKRDLIDAFQKIVDNGYMTKAEAAVHILIINRAGNLPHKYNACFKEFWQKESNITGWIRENEKEIKADKRAFRAIQLLLSTFCADLTDYLDKVNSEEGTINLYQDEFLKIDQKKDYQDSPDAIKKYVNEIKDGVKIIKEYHVVERSLGDFRKSICWERGHYNPDIGQRLYFVIRKNETGYGAETEITPDPMSGYPVSAKINIDGYYIDIHGGKLWLDFILHEYFHTCQFSYTAKDSTSNWFYDADESLYRFCMEGTAVLMTDIFINMYLKYNSEYSPKFENSGTAERTVEYFKSMDPAVLRSVNPYALTAYFYYILDQQGLGLFDPITKKRLPYDSECFIIMSNLWKAIEGDGKNQDLFNAIRNFNYNGLNYLNFFHKFNVDNMLFNFGLSEATYGGLKAKFVGFTPFPEQDIKKIPYSPKPLSIMIDADSVCYRILYPPDNEPTFKKCVFVAANGFNKNLQTVSAIEIIDKDKKNPSYNVKTLPIANDGSCTYELITQNGIIQKLPQKFDWTKVIFVFTNASNKSVKAGIMCGAMAAKPDEVSAVYSRPKNLELSNLSGSEYKLMMSKIYINWKLSCIETEKDLLQLIAQTQPAPLPIIAAAGIGNQLLMNRIIEKYKQLNIAMQEGIVSAHDIRYQFYLRKNYIVSKICEGATSASVLAQLKRLKEYLDDINAVLNNAQNDKIISVIGAMVGDHALTQLTNTKNPMDTPWTDEEDKVNQSINSVKGKIQSVWKKSPYFFNSSDFGNAYTAVGNPAFEIVYQIGKQPAPVNIVPNLKNEPFAKDMVYTISSTVKNFTGVNYKEYLFSDKCVPMDLKYFSVIKKHDYREEFMPPEPGTPGYFKELNEIAYFRLNAHKCKYENIDLMPPDIIAAVSRKYEEFKRRTIDAIIIQFHKGKFDLLNSIKENVASIDARDELLTILTAALEEIKAAEVVNANAPNDIIKITESIGEISVMLIK